MLSRPLRQRPRLTLATALIAFGAVVALLVVPSAMGVSVTPANGRDFLLPNNDVYQLGPNGTFHLIPDVATANAMGLNWNKLQFAATVGPVGAAFPSVLAPLPTPVKIVAATTMANGRDYILPDGRLFQRDADGVYHWIPNVTTANAMGIKWNHLIRARSVSPVGAAIKNVVEMLQPTCTKKAKPSTMANGMDYIVPPNPSVYQRDSKGVYHLIPNRATANAMGLNWNKLRKVGSVAPIGRPIESICLA